MRIVITTLGNRGTAGGFRLQQGHRGTPVAAPGQTGLDTSELVETTCREYLEMDVSGQRDDQGDRRERKQAGRDEP